MTVSKRAPFCRRFLRVFARSKRVFFMHVSKIDIPKNNIQRKNPRAEIQTLIILFKTKNVPILPKLLMVTTFFFLSTRSLYFRRPKTWCHHTKKLLRFCQSHLKICHFGMVKNIRKSLRFKIYRGIYKEKIPRAEIQTFLIGAKKANAHFSPETKSTSDYDTKKCAFSLRSNFLPSSK